MRPKELLRETSRTGIVLLVVLVALVGGTGLWMIAESRERVQKQILKEHSLTAHLQAELVGAEVANRLHLVESYATRPSIVEAAERRDWTEIGRQLERFVREDEDFSSAAITEPRGQIRALRVSDASMAGDEAPYRNNYRAIAEAEPFVSDAFFLPGTERRFGIVFSAGVEAPSGRLLGVLQAISKVTPGSLIPAVPGRHAGEIELFDKRGTPILGNETGGLSSGFDHFGVTEALTGRGEPGVIEIRDRARRSWVDTPPCRGCGGPL